MEHPTGKISPMGFIISSLFAVISWGFNNISSFFGWTRTLAMTGVFTLDEWVKVGQIAASVVAIATGLVTIFFAVKNNRKSKREKKQ